MNTKERLLELLKKEGVDTETSESIRDVEKFLKFVESEKSLVREEIRTEILRRRNNLVDKAMLSETGDLIKDVVIECCDGLLAFLTPHSNKE